MRRLSAAASAQVPGRCCDAARCKPASSQPMTQPRAPRADRADTTVVHFACVCVCFPEAQRCAPPGFYVDPPPATRSRAPDRRRAESEVPRGPFTRATRRGRGAAPASCTQKQFRELSLVSGRPGCRRRIARCGPAPEGANPARNKPRAGGGPGNRPGAPTPPSCAGSAARGCAVLR